jgi:hypothetical protein
VTEVPLPQLGEGLDPQLRHDLAEVVESIPLDDGGGATSLKVFLLAELIVARGLLEIVEIGVYRGRLFLPLARLMTSLERGRVTGIDPYSAEAAVQRDDNLTGIDLVAWPTTVDWAGIHATVAAGIDRWSSPDRARLVRARSEDVDPAQEFDGAPIDLLHIDGNHDRDAVEADLERFLPHMRDRGLLVMDDVGWPSVRAAFEELARDNQALFRITESGAFLTPGRGGNDFAIIELRRDPSARG